MFASRRQILAVAACCNRLAIARDSLLAPSQRVIHFSGGNVGPVDQRWIGVAAA